MTLMKMAACLSAVLFVLSSAGANPGTVTVLAPSDRSVVTGTWLPVVVALDGDPDRVVITRDKEKARDVCVPRGGKYLCTTIAIGFGLNEIGLRVMKDGRTVGMRKLSIFCRSDIWKNADKAPSGYRPEAFHSEENEGACRLCHEMDAGGSGAKPQRPESSPCYRCHRKITSYAYVHGPAAVWTCLTCHDAKSVPYKYATRQPDRVLCFSCHGESRTEWAAKKYVHGPTATGKCTICHNPHASDNRFFLKKPIRRLCVSCHEDRDKEAHVLDLYALLKIAHPTRGYRDPSRPGRMLSCTSCHNPHASNADKLLAYDGGNVIYDFCNRCHKK